MATATKTDPLFDIGEVPMFPHCEIQERKYKQGEWKYFIHNYYNPWASGWKLEDDLVEEITNKQNEG